MKLLALRPHSLLEGLRAFIPAALLCAAIALGAIASSRPDGWTIVGVVVAAGAVSASVFALTPGQVLLFYFSYLMFEGSLKILSSYNPVVRLGSDLLLGFAVLRLIGRHNREQNPSLRPEVRRRLGTLVGFFTIFWLWVAVQFVNPWGLGLLPSLAGLKVYLIPLLVFFTVGIYMRDSELRALPYMLLVMGLFQATVSVIDWYAGPSGLPSLHPKYAQVLWEFLQGFPYRPFGTTNLPGAPALWMFHCLTGSLIAMAQLKDSDSKEARTWRWIFGLFVTFALLTLVACQVRLALLRFLALLGVGLFLLGRKQAVVIGALVVGGLVGLGSLTQTDYQEALATKSFIKVEDRFQIALSRFGTLKSQEHWKSARGGDWALKEFLVRGEKTYSGIGLSRIGAASAPWVSRIAEDPYFNAAWGFADNLALALFTELGLGGLAGYILLVLAVLGKLIGVGSTQSLIAAAACGLIFFSGWGSEGILFQPDASLFWMTAAFGLRSPRREEMAL
jgi:hypothetical protein